MIHPSNDRTGQYARPNDRWQCSLDDTPSCGGSGHHRSDPGRCLPGPSIRLQRSIFTFSCTAMVIGLLLACWNSPKRNEFLAPGPLTNSHAQILLAKGENRCSSCHAGADNTLSDWIRDAVSSGKHIPVSQSQLCMECHDRSLSSEFAMQAHNLAPDRLERLTANTLTTHASSGLPDPRNLAGELACATCHREHHGSEFNLSALSDKQCQTCHVNYLHSFERDHPEFNNWPFHERTGIAFDHVSHGVKHFATKQMTFDCRKCHIDDLQGNVKKVAPFEVSCAQCHQSEMRADHNSAWTLFQIPMLDTEALKEAGYAVGIWPDSLTGDFDGALPSAMKLLLMADLPTAAVLERRGKDFEFSDLNPLDAQDLSDASVLAWSIKELLYDLAINGNQQILDRLNRSLAKPIESQNLKGLTHGLNNSLFVQAQQQWMPGLLVEITSRNSALNRFEAEPPNRIFGRPQQFDEQVLAENPLTRIYQSDAPETMNSTPEAVAESSLSQSNENPGNSRDMEIPNVTTPDARKMKADSASASNARKSKLNETAGPGRHHDENSLDLLVVNPLTGLATEAYNANETIENTPILAAPTQPEDDLKTRIEIALKTKTGIASGGWYRNDDQWSISYRVATHIDPLIKSWTDLAIENRLNLAVETSRLFDSMNSIDSAGHCRRCHTVDTGKRGLTAVNWSPKYRDVSVREFTRFSHRPHDIQTSLQDCTSCHKLDKTRSNRECFAGFDPLMGTSNFAAISKSSCASCHRPGGAPSGCVDCHHYHVGSRVVNQP